MVNNCSDDHKIQNQKDWHWVFGNISFTSLKEITDCLVQWAFHSRQLNIQAENTRWNVFWKKNHQVLWEKLPKNLVFLLQEFLSGSESCEQCVGLKYKKKLIIAGTNFRKIFNVSLISPIPVLHGDEISFKFRYFVSDTLFQLKKST